MVMMFMVFVWNITGFDLCFPVAGRLFPSSWLWHNNLVNYAHMSKTETFFFSLCLVLTLIEDSWVLSSLFRWMEKTVMACAWISIFWGPPREKSTKTEYDDRPLAWLSWPWEAFWEFSLRLLRNSTTASLEEPIWSIDQTYFASKLIWLCLVEIRVILEKKIFFQ